MDSVNLLLILNGIQKLALALKNSRKFLKALYKLVVVYVNPKAIPQ